MFEFLAAASAGDWAVLGFGCLLGAMLAPWRPTSDWLAASKQRRAAGWRAWGALAVMLLVADNGHIADWLGASYPWLLAVLFLGCSVALGFAAAVTVREPVVWQLHAELWSAQRATEHAKDMAESAAKGAAHTLAHANWCLQFNREQAQARLDSIVHRVQMLELGLGGLSYCETLAWLDSCPSQGPRAEWYPSSREQAAARLARTTADVTQELHDLREALAALQTELDGQAQRAPVA